MSLLGLHYRFIAEEITFSHHGCLVTSFERCCGEITFYITVAKFILVTLLYVGYTSVRENDIVSAEE